MRGWPTHDAVEAFLEAEFRPWMRRDGGDCQVDGVDETGELRLTFTGAYADCPAAARTLSFAIERALRERFGEMRVIGR